LIGAASLAGIVLNYAFLLLAGRKLGADSYGDLAALLGLLTVVLLPAGALQLAVSREVSRRVAAGDEAGADAFLRAAARLAGILTLPLLGAALVLSWPLGRLLGISTAVVALTALAFVAALLVPVLVGAIQGFQRFTALAAMYALPFALRLCFLGMAVAAGFALGGAVLATVAATLATTLFAALLVREPLRRGAAAARPGLGPFLRYLGPVVLGLVGIAVLTNLDVVIVNVRFPRGDTGDYAAASAFAKVGFFLPATILSVLFPRTAARQARGEDTEDILGRSLLVAVAFCSGLALFYALAGRGLVVTTYGVDFVEGGKLTAPYAVAMGLYALVNILVGYHLSRGETRYAWIVAAAAPVQLLVLALVPSTLTGVVWANAIVATALLAVHEVFVDTSVPALAAGARRLWSDLEIAPRVGREAAFVLGGATVFVCALFLPLVLHLDSMVVGRGSDAVGAVWAFWRWQHEGGYHLFGVTHHQLTGAPFGWDEGNGLNLQALLVYYPAYLVTKVVGSIAAYNLVLLSGYVLSGASMYLLLRYVGCNPFVAAWAGMVYVIFPWHLLRTPHGSLVHLELLPLLLMALLAVAQRPSLIRFGLVGLVTLGLWLTAGYFGTMALVAVGAFAVAVALLAPLRQGAALIGGTVGAALGASLFVAFLSVVSGVGRGAGLHRVPGDLYGYGLRFSELVVPDAHNIVFGGLVDGFHEARLHGSNPTETANYVGLLTLALALGWLAIAWRRRSGLDPRARLATVGFLAVLVASLLLALPSPVHLAGVAITAPSRLLWEVIPAIRVPSRWVALVTTALVPLAALGLQAAWRRLAGRDRRSVAAVGLIAAAVAISFLELAVNPTEPRIRTAVPAAYRDVAQTPQGILAEYPLVENVDNLLWQRVHGRPVLNNAAFGTAAGEAERVLVDPAAPGTAAQLAFLGVTAILSHPDALAYVEGAPDVPNASWGMGYALVARTPDGSSVWRVTAEPAPALVTLPGGFDGPTAPEYGVPGYPFIASSGVGTFQFTAQEPALVRLRLDASPPGREQTLRLGDDQKELEFDLTRREQVSALVQIPRGTSYLLVKTDPAATSDDDAIVVSSPRAERASGGAQLHAVLISPDPGF
jgi:O-antigen/teichoic acid export membrane protein